MSVLNPETDSDTRPPSLGAGLLDFPKPSQPGDKDKADPLDFITPKPPAKRGPGRPRKTTIKDGLTAQFALIGVTVSAFNQYDGAVILSKSEPLADSLARLAEENDSVKNALEALLTASAWSGVIMASAGMVVPIMANHGMAPAQLAPVFNVPNPDEVKRHKREREEAEAEDD